MSKKITDKIKELLTPEDLKVFESAIEKMIDQKVKLREEELKNKYDELAEEYVTKAVQEKLEFEKANLIESYDGKLKNIEKKVITKLSSFLDHVIVEQISDSSIEKLAINEVALPIVEQIKKTFSNNYIDLDTDGSGLLKQESVKVAKLEKELSEAHSRIMESEERLEKSATFLLISEKTAGLTNSQKNRVIKMFKNKKFDEVNESIETFVDMINESSKSSYSSPVKAHKIIDDVIEESDFLKEERPLIKEEKEEFSFAERANKYLDI
jgi:hypothetical protein